MRGVCAPVVTVEQQLTKLFQALSDGDIDAFLSGCSRSLVLTVWGNDQLSTLVPREAISAWYNGLRGITEGTFRSELLFALSVGVENVVLMRHRFVVHDEPRQYDTINHCLLDRGELAAWFVRPSNSQEYAYAWRRSDRGETTQTSSHAQRDVAPPVWTNG